MHFYMHESVYSLIVVDHCQPSAFIKHHVLFVLQVLLLKRAAFERMRGTHRVQVVEEVEVSARDAMEKSWERSQAPGLVLVGCTWVYSVRLRGKPAEIHGFS